MDKATNSASMRLKNERMILSLIRRSAVSRADIAKRIGLSKAAVSIIVDDLKQRGIVTERTGKTGQVGRTPVMLYLNDGAAYTVGVNITRRHITVGITDLGGNTVAEDTFAVAEPTSSVDAAVKRLESQLCALGQDRERVSRVSIVTPGPVDSGRGVILNPPNFSAWHGFPIAASLQERLGLPTSLNNVSSAIAIAEQYFGAARDTENFLALQVDEGIGSGIVVKGALLEGPCELGHTSIAYDGVRCECGNRGCLEKYAAIPRVLSGTRYRLWKEAVDAEDEELLHREADYLATAIISANNVFRFDRVVLCGALAYRSERLITLIDRKIKESILSQNGFLLCAGEVSSKLLVASSVAIRDFFNPVPLS